MKFTQVFTLGLFALSTQAAAIPQESTTEVDKRLDADVAAQLALNILNLIQLGIGANVNVTAKETNPLLPLNNLRDLMLMLLLNLPVTS